MPIASQQVVIDYTNYRGERETYRISIGLGSLAFGYNEYHPEPQWLLNAWVLEDGKTKFRTFAMKNIHSWRPAQDSDTTSGA